MKTILSWHGSDELKQAVLSQMEEHYTKATLDEVKIDNTPLNVYGWKNNIDFPLCAKMLGLEEGILQLGCFLFEGFPEDWKSIRAFIRLRIEMFEHIPVNVELGYICNEFIVWRLEEADFGITSPDINQQVNALLLEAIEVFYQDVPDMQMIQPKIQIAIDETNAAIAAQWQKHKTTDHNLYRKSNALKMAATACQAFVNPSSAADTAAAYIHAITNGGNTRNSDDEWQVMSNKFIQLLQAANK